MLRAFATYSLQELWNSEHQPEGDRLGTLARFNPPRRVYVLNYHNAVSVYGLLPT